MNYELNALAAQLVEDVLEGPDDLRVAQVEVGDGLVLDFGVETEGGLEAGAMLASICMSGLADIFTIMSPLGDLLWPHVQVTTDFPVPACLFSQYAGWKVSVGKFFAMGSGPMRAVAATEELFDKLWYREEATEIVGVLETGKLPDAAVLEHIAEKAGVEVGDVSLIVAPTCSMAGNYQVVARSVETAMHKLHELGFDVNRVRSAQGIAPLPPVANNDLQGIGRTNDAILYGGRVTLWVQGDDESLREVLPRVPSSASAMHGRPFSEIFDAAGRDFYKIDPMLFSPAEVTVHNIDTGTVHHVGRVALDVLKQSFGL